MQVSSAAHGGDVESMKEKNIFFVGGGIGMAPLRTLFLHMLDHRGDFGAISLLYGARSPQDLSYSYHSAPPVVRDGYFYRRTRRPQFSTSQEAIIIAFPLSLPSLGEVARRSRDGEVIPASALFQRASTKERCHAAGVTERFPSSLPPFFKGH